MSKVATLTRAQKAATILVAMGKPSAGKLLRFFKQDELRALIEGARLLKTISQADLDTIVAEFEAEFAEGAGLLDSADTMDTIFSETLTPEEMSAIMQGDKKEPKEAAAPEPIWPQLEKLSIERLTALLEKEHPQTVALILSNLSAETAAKALAVLPKDMRIHTVRRMMSMNEVPETARRLVENQMRAHIDNQATAKDNSASEARVAGLLNFLDKTMLDEMMQEMAAAGTAGLDSLKAKLFSFEELPLLDERSRVKLFDGLSTELVTLALRGAQADVSEAVLSSLGARSRRMIESELADSSVTPKEDDIGNARRSIAATAVRLAGEEAIELPKMQEAA